MIWLLLCWTINVLLSLVMEAFVCLAAPIGDRALCVPGAYWKPDASPASWLSSARGIRGRIGKIPTSQTKTGRVAVARTSKKQLAATWAGKKKLHIVSRPVGRSRSRRMRMRWQLISEWIRRIDRIVGYHHNYGYALNILINKSTTH